VDPGFAAVGWAVVDLDSDGDHLVSLGVLRTVKSSKKANVLAAADNFRRAKEIGRALARILLEQRCEAICAEAMSFPRSSSVAAKMAMCWGVLAQICEALALPLVQASPKDIKRAATGSAAASKDDVQAALSSRFPDAVGLVARIPRGLHEHAFDAAGAVVACRDSEVIGALARRVNAYGTSLTKLPLAGARVPSAYGDALTKPTEGVADV
jgi:Holliday junction resolvasome RuvABC endonuclease subunit